MDADLSHVTAVEADFSGTSCRNVKFDGANCHGAGFCETAYLADANLTGTDFSDALAW